MTTAMIESAECGDDGAWTVTLCAPAAWIMNRHTLSTARGDTRDAALAQAMRHAEVTSIVRPRRPIKRLLLELAQAL